MSDKFTSEEFKNAQKIAKTRLYPPIFCAGYLELRRRRILMVSFFSKITGVKKILDVGSQYCPYFPLFKDKCEEYLSMDTVDTPIVDIVCNAEEMQLEDESIDIVICTQVLEHCNNPQRVIDECHRVLKQSGILIVTVPSVFPVHGYPSDNWRFMPEGLKNMLKKFSSVKVIGEMDFPGSWISVNFYYMHILTGKLGILGKIINRCMHLLGNIFALCLSFVLKPFAKNNFSAFSMTLWAKAQK